MALTADQLNTIYNNVLQRNVDFSGIQFFANRQDISDAQVRQQIELSNESQTLVAPIVRLYDEVLGRVPDAGGLKFFVNAFRAGSTLEQIAQQLISSAEFQGKTTATAGAVDVTDLTNTNQLVTDAFQSILGRSPSAGEFAYFQGRSPAQILSQISVAPEAQQLQAAAVVSFLDSAALGTPNTGGLEAQNSGTGGQPNAGTTFVLTTGTDNVVGTGANDTITGLVNTTGGSTDSTLTAADTVNGGAGTQDILSVTSTNGGAVLNGALVSNIEGIVVRNTSGTAATLDASTAPGLTFINSNLSSGALTVTNAANNTAFGLVGNGTLVNGVLNAGYADAATSARLTIANGTAGTAGINVTGLGLTSTQINSVGAANTVGTISLANTVKTVTIAADTALTTSGITGVAVDTTITASGAGKLSLGTLATNVLTVDASANTGGVTLTLDNDVTTKFTGGSGADVVTLGTTALTTGSVSGAGGIDTLVANGTNLDTAATGAKYTGFEVLRSTGGTVNLDNISGITSIELNGGNVQNVTAAQAGAVKVLSSGTYTIDVKGASTVGQIDTVALTVDDGLTAKNTITLTTPVLTGVEKLTINAVDNVSVTSLTGATSLTEVTLSGAGDQTLTAGAVNLAANAIINAAAATGALTIDASAAQGGGASTGFSITGGTGIDTINGTLKGDVINGGAGNDILFGRSGADTINGGDGNDTIQGDGTGVAAVPAVVAAAEQFTATLVTAADGTTIIFDGATYTAAAGNGATVASATTAFVTAYNATLGTTYTAVDNGGTATFTAKATGPVADATPASFTGTANGVGNEASAVNVTTQGVAAAPAQAATITIGADTAGADILTGGAGNDVFRFASTSTTATTLDSITDLNLGTDAAAGNVDTLVFQNTGATVTVVALTAGQQASVTAAGTLTTALGQVATAATADGATAQFTYGTDTYIFHNSDGNGTYDAAVDFVVKVTGVTGTLNASDVAVV